VHAPGAEASANARGSLPSISNPVPDKKIERYAFLATHRLGLVSAGVHLRGEDGTRNGSTLAAPPGDIAYISP
jgi:hypothetical protein